MSGTGELLNTSEVILTVPKGSSSVLVPQGSILTPGEIRRKPLSFHSGQLSLLWTAGAMSPISFTELSEKLLYDNHVWFVFTLPLFKGVQAKAQIYKVFRRR